MIKRKNGLLYFSLIFLFFFGCTPSQNEKAKLPESIEITKDELKDKIKGGWAGQVIGCTYGGPTEFRFNGTMIQDYMPIHWDSTLMLWWYENAPGLYDDVYMDLTFVNVFDEKGINAPAKAHADAFANADYSLWHANQAARYNILNGIDPPASGYWENNPHSEDIDFQIEADFAGLMSPGLVNVSSEICDKVGHIMNYGDGWYGGVYVAAMYSLAFVSNDMEFIVEEALKTIPEESQFYQCIRDVITWHELYPGDWKETWFEVEKKWSSDIGCPDGVFSAFNIDAKVNAAYIVIGLLYGGGDYGKTVEISTRCGQDSDCNPASAAGILGTMVGYKNIPEYWKQGLDKVEDMDFSYTTISLNDVYVMGFDQAMKVIMNNGGKVMDNIINIPVEVPEAVKFERGFEGHYPVDYINFGRRGKLLDMNNTEYEFEFDGIGYVVSGRVEKTNDKEGDLVQAIEVFLDGKKVETAKLPTNFTVRKHDITWKFNIPRGTHKVKLKLLDENADKLVRLTKVLIYDETEKNN